MRLWSIKSGTAEIGDQIFELPGLDEALDSATFSPDGKLVVIRSGDKAQVWDVEKRQERFTLTHGGLVRMASFAADGRLLVTRADDKIARVWDVQSGEPKFTFEHQAQLNEVSVSPDGHTVLTVQNDGTARLWDLEMGKERLTLHHGCGVRDAWFIAAGSLAVTSSRDDGFKSECDPKIMVWDVRTGREHTTMGVEGAESVGFSRNGKLMFSVHNRRGKFGVQWMHAETLVQVWDVDTGEERFPAPLKSDEPLRTAAFSPDGKYLVTTSGNTALIWSVAGELLQSTIAAATTVCLKPEFRRQYLGESATEARRKYAACERKHGRER